MTTRSLTARRARESSTKTRTSLDTITNSIFQGYKTVNKCISFNISELACVLLICLGQRQPENRSEKKILQKWFEMGKTMIKSLFDTKPNCSDPKTLLGHLKSKWWKYFKFCVAGDHILLTRITLSARLLVTK